jgi:hypothetical protein
MIMRKMLLLLAAAALAGCSQTNLADVVGQLSKDSATSCFDVQIATPWGTQKATYARSNSSSSSAASDTNGCAFQHGGTTAAPANGAAPLIPLPAVPAAPAVSFKPLAFTPSSPSSAPGPTSDMIARVAAQMQQH